MRRSLEISRRMRDMLTHDNVNLKEGFAAAMRGDLKKLADNYFVDTSPVDVCVDKLPEGNFRVNITFEASDVRRFDTTYDVNRY